MFNSPANRRRRIRQAIRPQFGHSLRRPLGFEAMEGRWLLSAMSLEVTALSLPVIPLTVQVGEVATPAGQTPQFNILREGGFISLNGLQADATSDSAVVLSGVVRSNWGPSSTSGGLLLSHTNSIGDF